MAVRTKRPTKAAIEESRLAAPTKRVSNRRKPPPIPVNPMQRGDIPTVGFDDLLTPAQVAQFFNVSVECLEQWRYRGQVLPYYKDGRWVRYRAKDVADLLNDAYFNIRGEEMSQRAWGAVMKRLENVIASIDEEGYADDILGFVEWHTGLRTHESWGY